MSIPNDRTYLESHEWHKLDGNVVTLGITQFAADELTDITFVALPKMGDKVSAGGRWGEVESVKATSDLYSGVDGEIVETNAALIENPALVNTDPFNSGWMIRIKVANVGQVQGLLSADEYLKKSGH